MIYVTKGGALNEVVRPFEKEIAILQNQQSELEIPCLLSVQKILFHQ